MVHGLRFPLAVTGRAALLVVVDQVGVHAPVETVGELGVLWLLVGATVLGAFVDGLVRRPRQLSPFAPLATMAVWPVAAWVFAVYVLVEARLSGLGDDAELAIYLAVALGVLSLPAATVGLALRALRYARREHLRDHPSLTSESDGTHQSRLGR